MHTPLHIIAVSSFEIELTLYNDKRYIDEFNTEILIILPAVTEVQLHAPWTAARSASQVTHKIIIPKRAYSDHFIAQLSTLFPLGLFKLTKKLKVTQKMFITPKCIKPIELEDHGSKHNSMSYIGRAPAQTLGEPRGIRPWQTGDSPKSINWPASAKSLTSGHGLQARDYDPPSFDSHHCHIIFHSYATGGRMLVSGEFERAISLLAGAILDLHNREVACSFTADFIDWQKLTCSTRLEFIESLRQLAKISRSTGTEAHELDRALGKVPRDHSLLIISDMVPEAWSHILNNHPHTVVIDIRQALHPKPLQFKQACA